MREAWRQGQQTLDRRARASAYDTAALFACAMAGRRLPDYETYVAGADEKPKPGAKNAAERREDLRQRKAADEEWINRLAAEGKL